MGSSNSSPKVSDDKSIVLDCNLYKNETDAVEGGYCEAMNFNLGPYYPPKYTYFTNGLAISAIGDVKMPVTLSYYLSDVNGNSVIIVCGNNGKEVYIVCSQIVSDHVSLNNNNSKIGGCSMIFGIYNEEFILTSGSDPSVALISAKCAYKYSSVQTTLSENILWGIKTNFTPITTSSTVNGNNPSSDSRNPLKKALSSGYNSNSTIYFGNKGRNDKNGIDDNNHKKILNNTSNSAIFNLPSEGTCNNASISFVIPKKMLLNNNETTLLIKDNSDIPLASVKFNSCCARLTNYNEEQFDTSAYPKGWYLWDIFNMTFAWTLTMYYLISSSNLQPLVSVLRANSTKCPSSIRLLDSSNTELQTHWHYRSHFTGIIPYECSLVNFNESCKSPILNINLVQQLDQQFLRFGFIAPPMNILPISMSLFSSGTPFATINFNKDHILIQTTIGNELFEMPNSIHEGNWVIGDLYFVQPPIKYAIKKSINLKSCTNNTSEDCLLTKNIKVYKKTYKEIKDMYSKVNHSYLYISLNNNIIVNTLSANEKIDRVIIYGRNNEYNLAYWKIKLGMSPSLHPPDSDLQHLENKIMIYNSVGPNYDLYDTNKDNLL